jgi:polar amino acid transport system substrate-binding protein
VTIFIFKIKVTTETGVTPKGPAMSAIVPPRGISANRGRFLMLVVLVTAWALLTPWGSAPATPGPSGEEVPLVKKKLQVGTREAPPFSMKDSDGIWTGIGIDLWRQIATELDLTYEFVELDQVTLLEGLTNGSLDVVVLNLTITPERLDRFDFTYPFYTTGLGIAVPLVEERPLIYVFKQLLSWAV